MTALAHASAPSSAPRQWHYVLAALGLMLLTTLVRCWFVADGQLDLVQDEAQYWDWSRYPQLSYYSKGPLIAWLGALGTALFGATELGVRAPAVFISLCSQAVLLWLLAGLWQRPRAAFWTLFLLNTTPLFMASGVLATTDNPLLLCWLLGLSALVWLRRTAHPALPLTLLALSVALGILAKYMMLVFVPLTLVYALVLRRRDLLGAPQLRGVLLALGVGLVIGFLPILLWNALNDWVGFRHVGTLAGVTSHKAQAWLRLDRFPEYLGSQVGLILPWWLAYILWGGWQVLRPGTQQPCFGERGEPGAMRFEERLLLGLFFWPLWLFFLFWSLHARVYPNWSAMSYAAGAMLGGFALARHLSLAQGRGRKLVRLWIGLGALAFVLLHLQHWVPVPSGLDPTLRLKGWRDLGTELARLQDHEFEAPDRVFYFADTYDITAALAFYAPGQPRSYCAYFDRRMNQYDLWPGPEDKSGWDALFVLKDFKDAPPPELAAMFASLELRHYQSTHRGQPARKFTVILCRGFNGTWPQVEKKAF